MYLVQTKGFFLFNCLFLLSFKLQVWADFYWTIFPLCSHTESAAVGVLVSVFHTPRSPLVQINLSLNKLSRWRTGWRKPVALGDTHRLCKLLVIPEVLHTPTFYREIPTNNSFSVDVADFGFEKTIENMLFPAKVLRTTSHWPKSESSQTAACKHNLSHFKQKLELHLSELDHVTDGDGESNLSTN